MNSEAGMAGTANMTTAAVATMTSTMAGTANMTTAAMATMTSTMATIANITQQSYLGHRTYGTFQIDGRVEGEAFALTRVSPRTAVMDYGDKRILPLAITAREIAEDLCREVNSDAGEHSFLGVFVCAGATPTEAELLDAQTRLAEFYRSLVASADREWERSHSFLFIHDLQRRAAESLGLEKEWFYRVRETAECPGWGERVKPHVAVCKSCGAILDRDKALVLGLVQSGATAAETRPERVVAGPRRSPHRTRL